jgi:hypothetical protein
MVFFKNLLPYKLVDWGEPPFREPQHSNVGVHDEAVHPNLKARFIAMESIRESDSCIK